MENLSFWDKLKNFTSNISTFFYSRDFEGDLYGWMTNQLGHTAGSLGATHIIYLGWKLIFPGTSMLLIAFILASFWFIWECRHLYQAENVVDFFEDLFFEWSGVLIFLTRWWLIIWIPIFIYLFIKKLNT